MKEDIDIEIDFRMLDARYMLYAIEEHITTIERLIEHLIEEAVKVREEQLASNDDDFFGAYIIGICENKVVFEIPWLMRSPLIISIYAMLESIVNEIAREIASKKRLELHITDIKASDFWGQAEKYYKHVLHFELGRSKEHIEWMTHLTEVRHLIAHHNGRIESSRRLDRIDSIIRKNIGFSSNRGFVVLDKEFVLKSFEVSRSFVTELIERFLKWDDEYK